MVISPDNLFTAFAGRVTPFSRDVLYMTEFFSALVYAIEIFK